VLFLTVPSHLLLLQFLGIKPCYLKDKISNQKSQVNVGVLFLTVPSHLLLLQFLGIKPCYLKDKISNQKSQWLNFKFFSGFFCLFDDVLNNKNTHLFMVRNPSS